MNESPGSKNLQVPVKPFPIYTAQQRFLEDTSRIKGFCGGRGTGKTYIAASELIMKARAGDSFMCVSPSYVILEDTTWPTFREVAEKCGVWIKGVKSPIPRVWTRTLDGGEADFVFRSGEKPDSLRGPSKSGVWMDEPSIMNEDAFKFALPCLRHKGKMGDLTLTFTPKGKNHWTYGIFYDREGNTKKGTGLTVAHTKANPFLPPEFYDVIRSQYTARLAEQELAGQFVDVAGLLFNEFNYVNGVPVKADRVRYWDKAGTAEGEGAGAYTCGVLMCRTYNGLYYVEDVIRGRWSYEERNKVMLETAHRDAEKYNNAVRIYCEQEPGSGGKESMQITLKMLAGFPVYRDIVSGRQWQNKEKQTLPGEAKVVRAQPIAAQFEAGNVYALRANWNPDWEEELRAFPESKYADQVDATSGAFNKLATQAYTAGFEKPERLEYPHRSDLEKGYRWNIRYEKGPRRAIDHDGNGRERQRL